MANMQATLYVLDVDQPVRQEVLVELRLPENGYDTALRSVPVWLTMGLGAVEMPLDNGLALRMELVRDTYSHEGPDYPRLSPAQVAGQ